MGIIIEIAKFILNVIYGLYKLIFKPRNKVTFLSRQADTPSIDFVLLNDSLKAIDKDLEVVMLTKRIGKGIKGKLVYALHIFKQMYHVATSKVVVIDGYQIVISVLKHNKDLKVVQIWHALGSLKKFGYSIADKKEGSKSSLINKMNMHKNYTAVLASSDIAKANFKEAFNVADDKVVVMGLPRIDFLRSEKHKAETVKKILENYPELDNGKKHILYVPTFRKNSDNEFNKINELIEKVDLTKYNLIVKLHHDKEEIYVDDEKIEGNVATGMEFLHLADYVVTDYSAISFEAALARKPIYYYIYDYDKYKQNRDMYIDFMEEMPGFKSQDAEDIIDAINKDIRYDMTEFLEKYVSTYNSNNTEILAKYILG